MNVARDASGHAHPPCSHLSGGIKRPAGSELAQPLQTCHDCVAKEAVMPVRYRSETARKNPAHRFAADPARRRRRRRCSTSAAARATSSTSCSAAAWPTCSGVDIVDIRAQQGLPVSPVRRRDVCRFPTAASTRRPAASCCTSPERAELVLLEEALRVSRAKVVVVEDTPSTAFDRLMNRRHGESYRRKIRSTAAFSFLSAGEWRWLFRGAWASEPEARPLSRFFRSVLRRSRAPRRAPQVARAGARRRLGLAGATQRCRGPDADGPRAAAG